MKIDCYISPDCASKMELMDNLHKALSLEAIDAEVILHTVDDAEAAKMRLKGSPSVFINGEDIMPGEISGFS